MNVEILNSWREVAEISVDWAELCDEQNPAAVFLDWEWVSAWAGVRNQDIEAFVLVCRDKNGSVQGIAPFYLSRLRAFSLVPVRVLRVLGDEASGQEYQDLLVAPDKAADVLHALAKALHECRDSWDLVWMPRVAGWNGAPDRILNGAITSLFPHRLRVKEFASLRLADSIEGYEATLPGRRRSQLRRSVRKISSIPGLNFRTCESTQDLDAYLNSLFTLHQMRWESAGIDGCFVRKPDEEAFYRAFAPVALENGWLLTVGAELEGKFVAVQFGYMFAGSFFQLQEGFNPGFENGIGNALRHHAIEECIARSIKEYDFLGGWTEHKRRWGSERRLGFEILIGSTSKVAKTIMRMNTWPKGRLLHARI